jgi:predicted component of type VI protein secretion system
MMILVMEAGPQPGMMYVIKNERITIGRAPLNDLVINDSRISRYHAQIRLMPGGAVIEDIGSTNGTFINGIPIHESHLLSDGELIGLADNVTLRFVVEGADRHAGENMETPVMSLQSRYPPPQPSGSVAEAAWDVPVAEMPPSPPADGRRITPPPPTRDVQVQERPAQAVAASPPERGRAPSPPRRHSRWLYVAVGFLIILILLFIALSAYLWFAPVDFWRWLLGLWGFRVP